jgi:esterase/lipase superfamily enzyme
MQHFVLNLRNGDSTRRFGDEPQWSGLNQTGTLTATQVAAQLSGKRVLALVHGYRVEDPIDAYLRILSRVECLYDAAILVRWPGSDWGLGFWWAKCRASKAGQMLAAALCPITCAALDVEAHSMGCRVTLEALASGLAVRNCILAAAAVDDESIQRGNRYGYAVERARAVLVAYSCHDKVLTGAYYLGAFDRALGQHGAQDRAWCAPHVRFVDCSATAGGHSAYKTDETFFAAWETIMGAKA